MNWGFGNCQAFTSCYTLRHGAHTIQLHDMICIHVCMYIYIHKLDDLLLGFSHTPGALHPCIMVLLYFFVKAMILNMILIVL